MPLTVRRLAVIENAGPNSVLATLKKLLKSARDLDVQVAFVTKAGLAKVLPQLRRVASRGRVRLLTGLYQGFTEAAALSELFAAQKQTDGRIEARIADETSFHRKLYLARTAAMATVVVGSSNLTINGLLSGGELNVLFAATPSSPVVKRLIGIFDADWESSYSLTRARIMRYKKLVRPRTALLPATLINRVLGARGKHDVADDPSDTREPRGRFWVDGIAGYVKEGTKAIIADETNWDAKGFGWYSAGTAAIQAGDRMVLFDHSEKIGWTRVVRVRGYTKTATRTPDGWHFVAYTEEAKTARRKITARLVAKLHGVGVASWTGKRVLVTEAKWKKMLPIFSH
jgi:HKD family nuclease